jgi:hypothetical protein
MSNQLTTARNIETAQMATVTMLPVTEEEMKDLDARAETLQKGVREALQTIKAQVPGAFGFAWQPQTYLPIVQHFDEETKELLEKPKYYMRLELVVTFKHTPLIVPGKPN